ncbi:hypothetical protein, partial [Klebsiella pneumoniae]|uniref:hypothetical protein n=1 Tax=Klebsiella pneumoniae TaxID=573 RepID=UPI0025A0B282
MNSLEKLSKVFLRLEDKGDLFDSEESEKRYQIMKEKICHKCKNFETCKEDDGFVIRQMLHEILYTVEDCGAELNA